MYFYENFFVPWRRPGHLFKSEKVGGPVSSVQNGFQIGSLRSPCECRGVRNGPSCASVTNRRERETAGHEDAEWAGWEHQRDRQTKTADNDYNTGVVMHD